MNERSALRSGPAVDVVVGLGDPNVSSQANFSSINRESLLAVVEMDFHVPSDDAFLPRAVLRR